MTCADLHPRGRTFLETLRHLARSVHRTAPSRAGPIVADRQGCRDTALGAATLYDIGACGAYRDYRSPLTLGAGTQPRLERLTDAARWAVMR